MLMRIVENAIDFLGRTPRTFPNTFLVEWLQRKALHLTSSSSTCYVLLNECVSNDAMFNAIVTPSSSRILHPAKVEVVWKKRVKDCWCILWVQLCILLAMWVSKEGLGAVSVTNKRSTYQDKSYYLRESLKKILFSNKEHERSPQLHFWFSGALKIADISYQVWANQHYLVGLW